MHDERQVVNPPPCEAGLPHPPTDMASAVSGRTNHDQAYHNLLAAAQQLVDRIHAREDELRKLLYVTENINRGLCLDEILEFVYQELRDLVPYNRIGLALIDDGGGQVIARWARSDRPTCLPVGYRAPLAGSTLENIVQTGRPRILNDLPAYLAHKPQSKSTQLIVTEGMRSSLTCPLVVLGRPVGFLFFSSDRPGTYSDLHVEFFQQIAGQLSVIVEKGRLYSELAEQAAIIERQNRRFTKEMELARRLQRALIPSKPPDLGGLETAFLYEPAIQVGGDVLEILPLDGGRALVFVGDAMGHGVEAAMLMATAKTSLHTAVRASSDPTQVLRQVNGELCELIGDRFVTAVCARFDPKAGLVEAALAGHIPPLHFDAGTGDVARFGDAGLPLGVKAKEDYPCTRRPIGPGDALVFCTDGITEAAGPDGLAYGEKRLADQVRRHGRASAPGLLQAIVADVRAYCGQSVHKDDFTVLVVRATDGRESAAGSSSAAVA